MVGLERMKVGNAVAIRRTSLLERLETASVGVSQFPGVMNARGSDPDASSATQKLPPAFNSREESCECLSPLPQNSRPSCWRCPQQLQPIRTHLMLRPGSYLSL